MTIDLKSEKTCEITADTTALPQSPSSCDVSKQHKVPRRVRGRQSRSKRKFIHSHDERRTKSACYHRNNASETNIFHWVPWAPDRRIDCRSWIQYPSNEFVEPTFLTWPLSRAEERTVNPTKYFNKCLRKLVFLRLGLDHASNLRNPWGNMSYADLIAMAIVNSVWKRLSLSEICSWFVEYIPFFGNKHDPSKTWGWKNSIRHNLSLHDRFVRVPLWLADAREDSPQSSRYVWALRVEPNEYSTVQLNDHRFVRACVASPSLIRKRRKCSVSNTLSSVEIGTNCSDVPIKEKRFRSLTPTLLQCCPTESFSPPVHHPHGMNQANRKLSFAHKHLAAFLNSSFQQPCTVDHNSVFPTTTNNCCSHIGPNQSIESQTTRRYRKTKSNIFICDGNGGSGNPFCARNSNHVLNRLLGRCSDDNEGCASDLHVLSSSANDSAGQPIPNGRRAESLIKAILSTNTNQNRPTFSLAEPREERMHTNGNTCLAERNEIRRLFECLGDQLPKTVSYCSYMLQHRCTMTPETNGLDVGAEIETDKTVFRRLSNKAVQTIAAPAPSVNKGTAANDALEASAHKCTIAARVLSECCDSTDRCLTQERSQPNEDQRLCNHDDTQIEAEFQNSLPESAPEAVLPNLNSEDSSLGDPSAKHANNETRLMVNGELSSAKFPSDDQQDCRELRCALNLIRHLRKLPQSQRTSLYQSLINFDLSSDSKADDDKPLDYSRTGHNEDDYDMA